MKCSSSRDIEETSPLIHPDAPTTPMRRSQNPTAYTAERRAGRGSSRESTYYEVDYNDGGELEEFTRHELVPMLVPQPPPRPSGSGASDTRGGTRGGSSGSERKNELATSSSRGQSPGGYMTEMELRAGVTPEVAAMERLIGRKVKHQVSAALPPSQLCAIPSFAH
jgi:hypothetical protein